MKTFLKVIEPGAYTIVQDEGRYGYRQFGVPPTGALDRFSYCVANMLVGNADGAAVLEFTFTGGCYEILSEADIALSGADLEMTLNGRKVSNWMSFRVRPGDTLAIGQAKSGCRAYLAVTGGIDVPVVMDSRSCYAGAKIGGHQGRALKKGDVIFHSDSDLLGEFRKVSEEWIPRYGSKITLRAIPGPQEDHFDKESIQTFFQSNYLVSSEASRLGYRLKGPVIALSEHKPKSIISEPSLPGSVQIPENGQPIILLAEQTVGGYAKIATVISTDIERVAQSMPGDRVRFERIDLAAAHQIYKQYYKRLENVRQTFEISKQPFDSDSLKSVEALWQENPEGFVRKINRYLIQI